MKDKLKNPIFWIGLVSAMFLAAGVDPDTLTSWDLVLESLKSIVLNPVAVVAVIATGYSIFNDNSTKKLDGFK